MICPRCQARAAAGNRFCGQCGSPLSTGPAAAKGAESFRRAAERRQLTVMFYDLVGSTALAAECDPEDFSEAMDQFHRRIREAVEPLGGYIGSSVGDGAVVYFGYPVAQENAAERAVLAGLRTVRAAGELVLPDGEPARVRVGIATGQGVVSRLSEAGSGNEVVGSVANLAARLQASAQPGWVVVSDATRRLVERAFDLSDLGRLEAKGFKTPVQGWRVLSRRAVSASGIATPSSDAPLVGREPELTALASALGGLPASAGRIVLVRGEAGGGKSRLAAEFADRVRAEGGACIGLRCSPHSQAAPLRPFVRHVRQVAGGDPDAKAFAGSLERVAPGTDPDARALLARLAGVDGDLPSHLEGLSAAQRLEAILDALLDHLQRLAGAGSLLLVFEDAHWADPTSLAVLERAGRDPRLGGVLILVTARLEFRPAWAEAPSVTALQLAPLTASSSEQVMAAIPGVERLPQRLRRLILQRADGVPLFIEELTRSVLEGLAEGRELSTLAADLPSTLQDSLSARLERLGEAKAVAQAASVIGRRFSRHLVERLLEEDIGSALERLQEAGLVVDEDGAGERFAFRHALLRDTAYAVMLRTDHRRLGARLLAVIEAELPQMAEQAPERVARYAVEAGAHEPAARYWLAAGLQTLGQSAMPEAIARLREGLASAAEMPTGPARRQVELSLELALGKAQIATVGYAVPETGATFDRARELCEAFEEPPPELLAVLHGQWIHDLLCSRLREARSRADDLLRAAQKRHDPVWTLVGRRARGVLAFPLGEFKQARHDLERGLAVFDPARRPEYARILVDDVKVVLLMYSAWVLSYMGEEELAWRRGCDALEEARALGQPYSLAHALSGRVLTGIFLQRYEDAEALVKELGELTRAHDIAFYAAVAEVLKGRLAACTGEPERGAQVLREAIARYEATHSSLYVPTYLAWEADALGQCGRIEEGLERLDQAAALMARTGMANDAAEVHRIRGVLLQKLGDLAGSQAQFEAALDLARLQGAGLFVRRAEGALAAPRLSPVVVSALRSSAAERAPEAPTVGFPPPSVGDGDGKERTARG